jgi:hypothetical protein
MSAQPNYAIYVRWIAHNKPREGFYHHEGFVTFHKRKAEEIMSSQILVEKYLEVTLMKMNPV